MKKVISILLVAMMLFSFVGCSFLVNVKTPSTTSTTQPTTASSTSQATTATPTTQATTSAPQSYNKIGDTVETDTRRVTIINAQFAVKIHSSIRYEYDGSKTVPDDYYTAAEYDPSVDDGNSYVASKGDTFVVLEYKVENTDRVNAVGLSGVSFSIDYDNLHYDKGDLIGATSNDGISWSDYEGKDIKYDVGKPVYIRSIITINKDVSNLDDDFVLNVSLLSSNGTQRFPYQISASDRPVKPVVEVSPLENAVENFTKEDGQSYFKTHMGEYPAVSGNEIQANIIGKKWDIIQIQPLGHWDGKYDFELGGNIKETIYDGSEGYFNSTKWSLNGDVITISNVLPSGNTDQYSYTVKKVNDNFYLFVENGMPNMIVYKSELV